MPKRPALARFQRYRPGSSERRFAPAPRNFAPFISLYESPIALLSRVHCASQAGGLQKAATCSGSKEPTMTPIFRLRLVSAACVAVLACACGDDNQAAATGDSTDGGAPAVAEAFPPALGPEDCLASTSEITISQPEGGEVWGGLIILEFEVEGGKVDSFEIQAWDAATEVWRSGNVYAQYSGQREDGSYLMAVAPELNDANKDEEIRLRIRPSQAGCPDGDWTETEAVTQGDPLIGTSWSGEVSDLFLNANLYIERTPVVVEEVPSTSELHFADAVSFSVDFGADGVLSQAFTVPLASAEGEPYDGCTLTFMFEGQYEVYFRRGYNGLVVAVSERELTSIEGDGCAFPTVEEMAISGEDVLMTLDGYVENVSINYLPLLHAEPGAPVWSNNSFGRFFDVLPQALRYSTDAESGYANGYVYTSDFQMERTN